MNKELHNKLTDFCEDLEKLQLEYVLIVVDTKTDKNINHTLDAYRVDSDRGRKALLESLDETIIGPLTFGKGCITTPLL